MDVALFVDENNRTLLPAKYVAKELGYSVDWNEATKEVTIKELLICKLEATEV